MSSSLKIPGSKRRRTEKGFTSTHQQQTQTLKRSKYWFNDGNVILQVENMQFRVHRGMLAHHSAVFKDTFGISQPEYMNKPLVEGCQVVPLDDSLESVKIMISIFYGKLKYVNSSTNYFLIIVVGAHVLTPFARSMTDSSLYSSQFPPSRLLPCFASVLNTTLTTSERKP